MLTLHLSSLLHFSDLDGWPPYLKPPFLKPSGHEKNWLSSWISDKPAFTPPPILFLLLNFNPQNRLSVLKSSLLSLCENLKIWPKVMKGWFFWSYNFLTTFPSSPFHLVNFEPNTLSGGGGGWAVSFPSKLGRNPPAQSLMPFWRRCIKNGYHCLTFWNDLA